MAETSEKIEEEELHAYVDGALDPSRRLAVALYLVNHPFEAARIEVFRAQKEGIHALFDRVLAQPVPPRLIQGLARRAGRGPRWRRTLATLGMALIALVSGFLLAGEIPRLHPPQDTASTLQSQQRPADDHAVRPARPAAPTRITGI